MYFQDFCKYFYVGKHWRSLNIFVSQNVFKTSDGLLSKLINGVGNAWIEVFTYIINLSNNAGKKGKEHKILTCDKVNYRMRHQFGVCGAFALAIFVLLPPAELFVQGGCVS